MSSMEYRSLQAKFQQQLNQQYISQQAPGTPSQCLSNLQRERSQSKMRKSVMRHHSVSKSPTYREDKSSTNIDDLERQWNRVKEMHNHFQNNVHSPMKTKYMSNSKLSDSQIKNVNILKLVPHYRINLEMSETEDLTKERNDYMGVILQKYGNIHKKSQVHESPASQVRVRSINRNDFKEIKRQASSSAPKSRQRNGGSTTQLVDLKHCQSEALTKFQPNPFFNNSNSQQQFQMMNQPNPAYAMLNYDGQNEEFQHQQSNAHKLNHTKKIVTKVNIINRVSVLPKKQIKLDMKGSPQLFKNIVIYQPNLNQPPVEYYSNHQILSQITNIKNQYKPSKSILYTPESGKKSEMNTPQKKPQYQRPISPRILKERNGR